MMKALSYLLLISALFINLISSTSPSIYLFGFKGLNVSLVDPETGNTKPYFNEQNNQVEVWNALFINSSTIISSGVLESFSECEYEIVNIETSVQKSYSFDLKYEDSIQYSFYNPNNNLLYSLNQSSIISMDATSFEPTGMNITLPSIISTAQQYGTVDAILDSTGNLFYIYVGMNYWPQEENRSSEYPCSILLGCKYILSFDLESGVLSNSVDLHFYDQPITFLLPLSSSSIICIQQSKNSSIIFIDMNPTNGNFQVIAETPILDSIISFSSDTINGFIYIVTYNAVPQNYSLLTFNYQSGQYSIIPLSDPPGETIKVESSPL